MVEAIKDERGEQREACMTRLLGWWRMGSLRWFGDDGNGGARL